MGFLPQNLRGAVNADCSPKGIHIADAMPHNKDFFPALYNFPQRMGFHPCLYAGHLLHLPGLPAEIRDFFPFLHHNLVAAPAQRKVDGHTGILVFLVIAGSANPHPNA